MQKLIFLILIFSTPFCLANKKYLIFVPGFYGSKLVEEKNKETVWVSAGEAIFGKRQLTLPISEAESSQFLKLSASEVLKGVSILGPLWTQDAYGGVVKELEKICEQLKCELVPIAYDWRKEPLHAAQNIEEKIQALSKEPGSEFYLIAHSYGALISSYYLRYGVLPYESAKENWSGLKKFKKVALVAAPFQGSMAIFKNILNGLDIGLNNDLLSPTAYSTFEAAYFLLPNSGQDIVYDSRLNTIQLDIFNAKNWRQWQWGLFNPKVSIAGLSDEAKNNYTSHWLSKAEKFMRLIHAPLSGKYHFENVIYLKAGGAKAVGRGIWLKDLGKPELVLFYKKDLKKHVPDIPADVVETNGDGTLTAESLTLPQPFQDAGFKSINSSLGHLEILKDSTTQKILFNFLNE